MRYLIVVKATRASEAGVMPGEELFRAMGKYHKELIAGYTIIEVQNEAQARELTRRFPQPSAEGIDCHIEVRRYYEMEDFAEHPCVAGFDHIPRTAP